MPESTGATFSGRHRKAYRSFTPRPTGGTDHGVVDVPTGLQDGQGALHDLLIPKFLNSHQIELLEAVSDQPEFGVVSATCGVDADVEGGEADLPWRDRRQLECRKVYCRGRGDLNLKRGSTFLLGRENLAYQQALMEVIRAHSSVVVPALTVQAAGVRVGCTGNEQQRRE